MNPERLRRVEELYFRMLELSAVERERALGSVCADDAGLAREVRVLLAHDTRVGGFLESPALGAGFAVSGATTPDELVGTVAGRYRLDARLASGGMGTVYRATRDGEFTQHVAIKVVKRGMDTDEILRRFRAERQTLAALSHPNIAGVIDGGALPDGRPYLVMEFVDGVPIDQYCDQHSLKIEERLAIFRVVCDAVGYAHQRLVVHRDLKPANILVTPAGIPKLLDFGIAKVLSNADVPHTTMTTVQERRLTPEYASPEQITGRPVTTAADVHSLGVILYELLSGTRPYHFETRTTSEIERVITESEPPLPSTAVARAPASPTNPADASRATVSPPPGLLRSTAPDHLRRSLRGDLDTIVMTAMRKDPQRRYPTVEQLAADIDRYLRDLPISARKDTLSYRVAKFVRRNTAATLVASVAVLALAAVVTTVFWQARIAARERDAAFDARDQAEAINAFLQEMLRSADPSRHAGDVSVRELLDETAGRISNELADRPLTQASIRNTLGATYLSLGLYDEAESHLRAAYQQRVSLLGEGHHDVAESKHDLAALLYAKGKYPEAETLLREAMEVFRTIRGDHNADTARVASSLGAVLRAQNRLDEAERFHRESLAARMKMGNPESPEVAESLNNLGGVLRQQGKLSEAEDAVRRSLEIRRHVLGEEHPLTAQGYANLAVMTYALGKADEAERMFRRAIEIEEKVLAPDHPELATTLHSLSFVLVNRKDYAGAIPLIERAVVAREQTLGASDPRSIQVRLFLASTLRLAGRFGESERVLGMAVEHARVDAVPQELRAKLDEELELLRRARTGSPLEGSK
ncbi:MAG: serine/threonine protein kinase [Phycisphaerales bacterium]|nr:serine/threonine protein kinase [Phycisphaerales bacterium]